MFKNFLFLTSLAFLTSVLVLAYILGFEMVGSFSRPFKISAIVFLCITIVINFGVLLNTLFNWLEGLGLLKEERTKEGENENINI